MRYREPVFRYEGDKRVLEFYNYITVKEKGNNFTGVYNDWGDMITSRTTFKSACKVGKLLEEAYIEGYNDAMGY